MSKCFAAGSTPGSVRKGLRRGGRRIRGIEFEGGRRGLESWTPRIQDRSPSLLFASFVHVISILASPLFVE